MSNWWDYEEFDKQKPITFGSCKCPVCKVLLGVRDSTESVTYHCEECKASFTFFPNMTVPSVKMDREVFKTCKCPACMVARGEETEEDLKPYTQVQPRCDMEDEQ